MFVFKLSQDDLNKVKAICEQKGYKDMTLDELKEVIKELDQSPNQVLSNHSLMKTREQILDFLYGWEWANLHDHEVIK